MEFIETIQVDNERIRKTIIIYSMIKNELFETKDIFYNIKYNIS